MMGSPSNSFGIYIQYLHLTGYLVRVILVNCFLAAISSNSLIFTLSMTAAGYFIVIRGTAATPRYKQLLSYEKKGFLNSQPMFINGIFLSILTAVSLYVRYLITGVPPPVRLEIYTSVCKMTL